MIYQLPGELHANLHNIQQPSPTMSRVTADRSSTHDMELFSSKMVGCYKWAESAVFVQEEAFLTT